jgi:hypothetical protein
MRLRQKERALCKWLRMKFSAGCLHSYIDSQQRRPAATSLNAKHAMFLTRISSSGACFAPERTLR